MPTFKYRINLTELVNHAHAGPIVDLWRAPESFGIRRERSEVVMYRDHIYQEGVDGTDFPHRLSATRFAIRGLASPSNTGRRAISTEARNKILGSLHSIEERDFDRYVTARQLLTQQDVMETAYYI